MVTGIPLESLRGVADPTRRQIVERLSLGGLSVGEIASGLPMSRPAVSKHLRVLRELGLVVETKLGRRRVYELVARPLEEIGAWVERLVEAEGTRRDLGDRAGAGAKPSPSEGARRRTTGPHRERSQPMSPPGEGEGGDRWRSW